MCQSMKDELLLIIFRDDENIDRVHTYKPGNWTHEIRNLPMKVYQLSKGCEFITSESNSLKRGTVGSLIDKVKKLAFPVKISNIFLLNKTPANYSLD